MQIPIWLKLNFCPIKLVSRATGAPGPSQIDFEGGKKKVGLMTKQTTNFTVVFFIQAQVKMVNILRPLQSNFRNAFVGKTAIKQYVLFAKGKI